MFTCPCCGYLVFDDMPGSYDICPICFWEDDIHQLYYPESPSGPNHQSLIESQVNFVQFGACNRETAKHVRPISQNDIKDPLWFPLWEKRLPLPNLETENLNQNDFLPERVYYWLRHKF